MKGKISLERVLKRGQEKCKEGERKSEITDERCKQGEQ